MWNLNAQLKNEISVLCIGAPWCCIHLLQYIDTLTVSESWSLFVYALETFLHTRVYRTTV